MIALILAVLLSVPSIDIRALISSANADFAEGRFESAREGYLAAHRGGVNNASLLYNLANTEYRLGRVGEAVLHYRQALRAKPRDPDILYNLTLARERVPDRVTEPAVESPTAALTSALAIRNYVSPATVQYTFIVSYTLLWFLFTWKGRFAPRDILFWSVLIALGVSGFDLFLLGENAEGQTEMHVASHSAPAVVLIDHTAVYAGNSETFPQRLTLRAGQEVLLGEKRGEWQEVMIGSRFHGFVRGSNVERI